MKAIILANINASLEDSRTRDAALVDAISTVLKAKGSDAAVRYVTSMRQLEYELLETQVILLVTNFPPDSTYHNPNDHNQSIYFGTAVHSFPADAYGRTKDEMSAILGRCSPARLVVITGAPRNRLTDEEILSVSCSPTYVLRKADLFKSPDGYDVAYISFVMSEVSRAFTLTRPEQAQWHRTQAAWQNEQVGKARILILSRSGQVGQAVARGLLLSFNEIPCPLSFLFCQSINEAHDRLLDGQFEIVLSLFDAKHWLPIHDAVDTNSVFGVSVAVIDATPFKFVFPPRTLVVTTDRTRQIDAQHLAKTIFAGLHQVRLHIQEPHGLAELQKAF
jgi:hypothetical protein